MTVLLHESLKRIFLKVHIINKCHQDWNVFFLDINFASNTLLLEENFIIPSANVSQWKKITLRLLQDVPAYKKKLKNTSLKTIEGFYIIF